MTTATKRTVHDLIRITADGKRTLVKTHRSEMQARNHKSILSGIKPGESFVIESREAR
jgi:hypothetical protein